MKVLFVAANARSLIANRGDLIREIQARGHQVHALIPEYDFLPEVEELGISWELIQLSRTGIDPLRDIRTYRQLKQKIQAFAPDVTFGYAIKPVIYGSLAARAGNVSMRAAMITGMGYLFTGNSLKQCILRAVAARLYRIGLGAAHIVFFQNPDDLALFQELGIIRKKDEPKIRRTNGSGVNMGHFSPSEPKQSPIRFLIIARLLQDKGVREFVQAAQLMAKQYPEQIKAGKIVFQIVGPHDPTLPHALPQTEVEQWRRDGLVELVGGVKDVRPYIEACAVYVLPSYREGTPRSVLEAMAMQRAIVTTDTPGCRETVIDGKNGYLVPVRAVNELAATMARFIEDPSLIVQMGKASYQYCAEKYDVNKVNQEILCHLLPEQQA